MIMLEYFMNNSGEIVRDLRSLGSKEGAKVSSWFFKTKKGEYGHEDIFFGVTVPRQREVAKKYFNLSLEEIGKLLKSKYHECRLTALFILVNKYKKSDSKEKQKVVRFYLSQTKNVNNWDLVDSSAPYILGDYLLDSHLEAKPPSGSSRSGRGVLYKLAKSKDLWERRIAIVSTMAFIKKGRFEDTLRISEILMFDTHDLIHKAIGWMLREIGKKSEPTLEKFLKKHIKVLPRTTLRYAIEKFPGNKRQMYLKKFTKL